MRSPRATLQQVAERAGVSRTTASYVMTGRRDMRISSAAEERVVQAARELQYRPSLVARALRHNTSSTIGFISDRASERFAAEAIRGSLTTALLHRQLLFVGETDGDRNLEVRLVEDMLDRGVGGFVYASLGTQRVTLTPILRKQPVVLLNCLPRGRGIPAVLPDDVGGGATAVQLLLRAGHTAGIYLVGETVGALAGIERRAGIDRALTDAGLELAGFVDCIWWPDNAYHAVLDLLEGGARPTAMICLNDRVAMGAYQAIAEMGLSVPDDVSVVSFDSSDLAMWLRPHLTSVGIPHFELGRRAIEVLLDDKSGSSVHRIPMPVVERDSIGPPARRRPPRKGRPSTR